jgi:UDP-sugar diphosphatase
MPTSKNKVHNKMPFKISEFTISAPASQRFVKPVQLNYQQSGQARSWEAVQSHDSVSTLLFHIEKRAFVLVKQFRAPVYMNHPHHNHTYELCAGIVDKDKPLVDIAREEIDEECGYVLAREQILKVSSFFTNVGISGSHQHLFFAFVNDKMKLHEGGGIESEEIFVEYLPLLQARDFIYDEECAKTPGLMFAFYWFFEKYGYAGEKLP